MARRSNSNEAAKLSQSLQTSSFSGAVCLYKLLAVRDLAQPLFLRRNLTIIPPNHLRKKRSRATDDLLAFREELDALQYSRPPCKTLSLELRGFSADTDSVDESPLSTVACEVSLFEVTPSSIQPYGESVRLIERHRRNVRRIVSESVGDSEYVEFPPSCFVHEQSQPNVPRAFLIAFKLFEDSQQTLLNIDHIAEISVYETNGNLMTVGEYELIMRPASALSVPQPPSTGPPTLTLAFHATWQVSSTKQPNDGLSYYPCTPPSIIRRRNCLRFLASTAASLQNSQKTQPALQINYEYQIHPKSQAETRYDTVCPMCSRDFFTSSSLIKHVNASHQRFKFDCKTATSPITVVSASQISEQQMEILTFQVSLNKAHSDADFFNRRTDNGSLFPKNYIFVRGLVLETTDVIEDLTDQNVTSTKRVNRLPQPTFNGKRMRTTSSLKDRVFYHSRTYEPIKPSEMDYDSEDDVDIDWLRDKTSKLVDEFTDVNAGEKEMMKLWNRHVGSYKVIPDKFVARCCIEFCERFSNDIWARGIRNNFALHLINLHNYKLLSADDVKSCLRRVDRVRPNQPSLALLPTNIPIPTPTSVAEQ